MFNAESEKNHKNIEYFDKYQNIIYNKVKKVEVKLIIK